MLSNYMRPNILISGKKPIFFFPRKFSFCKKPNHCIGDHNIQSLWETNYFLKVESHDQRPNENKDSDIENEESNHGGEVFDDPNEFTKTKVSILGVAALWDDCMDQNLFEMPTKNDVFFTAQAAEKKTSFLVGISNKFRPFLFR